MRSIVEMTRWLHLIIATLAVWSQDYVQALFDRLSIGQYYLFGTVVLALVAMQLSDRAVTWLIDHVQVVRMLIAGRDDIEGDWVNIVVSTASPKEIIAAEYCRIRYQNGEYVLTGDTWTLDGKWIQDFRTGGSRLEGREFEYYYRTGLNRVGGFGVILFSPHDSIPTDFICRYVDEDVKVPHVTRGRRVARRLRRVSQDKRRDAALKFAASFDAGGMLDLEGAFIHYNVRA